MNLRTLLYLFLFLNSSAWAAEPPADPVQTSSTASASEIEAVINTLEDKGSRDQLVQELKTLLEARKQASVQEEEVVDATDLWQWITNSLQEIWNTIVSVDPRHVLIASLTTIAIILGGFLIRWLALRGLQRLYAGLAKRKDRDPDSVGLPANITRLITLILVIAAIAMIAESWGANVGTALQTDFGAKFFEMLISIGLILMITVVLWHAADIVVERTLRMHAQNMEHERRARRLDTLVPLLRSIIQITIAILSALLILSELGINIGPLLAGAGILGLAVGFGAQTLVKDLITGVTILLEDAASLDDVIEVGGHMGKVEEMRIRVLQLRDLAGVVHVIPYSEVTSIKNYTKDFSYYLFDVGIAYREDVDEVMKVLGELSDEICKDEEFKDMILEPLEILGLDQFADSAVVIKARIKTQPKDRWTIGREFNRRIKKRFDEEGIEIPFPHRTIYFGEPKEGMAPSMPLTFAEKEEKLLEKLAGKAAD